MKKSLSLTLAIALLGAIALARAERRADQDWREGGRWLTPYTLPGYDGYGFALPAGKTDRR